MSDVLVVDDDPGIRALVSSALAMDDIPHRMAGDGAVALALIEQQRPALVLLDINMPVLDGVSLCRTLDERGERNGLPIVVMTASLYAAQYERECAAVGRLIKPFDIDDLYAVIARFIAA